MTAGQRIGPEALRTPVTKYQKSYHKPPIPVPLTAIFLSGLRTVPRDRFCCIVYSDRFGRVLEKRISFAAAARVLKWLGTKRLSLPIQVRRREGTPNGIN